MAGDLSGRVALVTGSGRGIGREIAIGLAAARARVALVARTEPQLHEVANTIESTGGETVVIVADIRNPDQVRNAVNTAVTKLGPISILINNAGVVSPLGPTRTLNTRDIETALAVNVGAVVILSGLVTSGMVEAGWGAGSSMSRAGSRPTPPP